MPMASAVLKLLSVGTGGALDVDGAIRAVGVTLDPGGADVKQASTFRNNLTVDDTLSAGDVQTSGEIRQWVENSLISDATDLDSDFDFDAFGDPDQSYRFQVSFVVATGTPDYTLRVNGSAAGFESLCGRTGGSTNILANENSFIVAGGYGVGWRACVTGEIIQFAGYIQLKFAVTIDNGSGGPEEAWTGVGMYFGAGPVTSFGLHSSVANGIKSGSAIRVAPIN